LECPVGGKREIFHATAAESGLDLPQAIAFAKGGELRQCFREFWAGLEDAVAENARGPAVISLEPKLAATTGLQNVLPVARLAGWVLRTQKRDMRLTLRLVEPRTNHVAGKAGLTVLAGVPVCVVAAIRPDVAEDPRFATFDLFKVHEAELTPLLRARIFVGVRGWSDDRTGWEQNLDMHCEGAGDSTPIDVWSWNGGDSDFAAGLQLQPGCIMGMWVQTGWQRTPLVRWPHPVWALYCDAGPN
jgi:hypothetical protein